MKALLALALAFASPQDAMEHATGQIADTSSEYGGVIYELAGRFYSSDPVTQGKPDRVDYSATLPASAKVTSLWHTHPEGPADRILSRSDIQTAVRMDLPMDVHVVSSGRIMRYDPKTRRIYYREGDAWRDIGTYREHLRLNGYR